MSEPDKKSVVFLLDQANNMAAMVVAETTNPAQHLAKKVEIEGLTPFHFTGHDAVIDGVRRHFYHARVSRLPAKEVQHMGHLASPALPDGHSEVARLIRRAARCMQYIHMSR